MTSKKKLRRLSLDKNVLDRLSKNNIYTCKDFLSCQPLELLKVTGLSYLTIRDLIDKCCAACVPKPVTGYDLLKSREERPNFFKTLLPDLDEVLHGGIPIGTITEIAGPSGCGKTQFCIMLSVLATLPFTVGGLGGSVLYLDTESAFSAERLVEVARAKFPQHFKTDDQLVDVSSCVFVDAHHTCSSLMKRLNTLEEFIISKKVKLLIVDSVASLVRKEYSSNIGKNLAERTNFLSQQAAILKYLAEVFSIPVVVTNQITTRFGPPCPQQLEAVSMSVEGEGQGGYVTAALGNTWSHCVNTRLILQYVDGSKRQILVAKSPVAPFTTFTYTIQDSGIVQEEDGAGHYSGTDPGNQHIQVRSAIDRESVTVSF